MGKPEVDHLSYSSISLYQSCGRAYAFRYVEKVATPVATALVFGSAFHDTIEAAVANPLANLGAVWSEMWGKRSAQDNIEWAAETPESLHNEGMRMLSDAGVRDTILALRPLYVNEQPVVERKVTLSVPGVPVPVIGYVDMIAWDCVPCDFKTAARSWEQGRAGNEMQPLVYLAALNQEGFTAHDWKFRHLVFVKTKKPQVQVIEHAHRPLEAFWLFDTVKNVWQAIQAGVFVENLSSWRCSAQYCDYWRWCRGKYG